MNNDISVEEFESEADDFGDFPEPAAADPAPAAIAPREWISDEERAHGGLPAAAAAAPDDAAQEGEEEAPRQLGWGDVVAASDEADEAKPVKAPRVRKVIVGGVERVLQKDESTDTSVIDIPLSDSEVRSKSKEMVRLTREKRAMEEHLKSAVKSAKGKIAEKEQAISVLEEAVESGVETRELDVVIVRDDRVGDMVTLSIETGQELGRRPQNYQERQLGLPVTEAAAPAPVDAAAPIEKPKKRKNKGRGAKANAAAAATAEAE